MGDDEESTDEISTEELEELEPDEIVEIGADEFVEIEPDGDEDDEVESADDEAEIEPEDADEDASEGASPPGVPPYLADEQPDATSRPSTMEVEAVEILEEEEVDEEADDEDDDEVDPIAAAAIRAEEGVHEGTEEALTRELKLEKDRARRAMIQHDLGHLYFAHMDDESQAVKAYALALKQDPRLRPNFWAIRRIFVARHMWPSLLKLLDAQIRYEKTPRRKAEILLERGWIQEADQADLISAQESYQKANEQDPSWLPPLLALEKIARANGDRETLIKVQEAMIEAAESPNRKVALLLDLADLLLAGTDASPEEAFKLLGQAAEAGSEMQATVLRRMDEVASNHGLHERKTEILQRQAEALLEREDPDSQGAAALLREAASLARDGEDLDGAATFTAAALEALPGDALLLEDQLALAEGRGDLEQAEDILRQKLEVARSDGDKADLWYRIGLCRLTRGDDADEAAEQADALLPGFLPLQAERERRLLMDSEAEELVAMYTAEAEAVEQGSPGLAVEAGEDPLWAATLYWRASALSHYQVDDQTQALELCRKALSIDADFQPANHLLEDLLRATGSHQELAELLERELARSEEDLKAQLLEDLIALHGGPLDSPERQLEFLGMLKEMRADDPRPLRLMAAALNRLGRHEAYEQVITELEALEQDSDVKVAWMLERARLYDGPMERPEDAAATYREILELAPEQTFASAALEQVLVSSGQHEELAQHLASTMQVAEEGDERRWLQHRLLDLQEHDLKQPEAAATTAADILADHPDDLAAMRALARLSEQSGDAEQLVLALERQLDHATEAPQRVMLQLQLAAVLEGRLEQADRAEELLVSAVQEAPAPELVVGALETLALWRMARGDHAEALEALEQIKDEAGEANRGRVLEEMAWLQAMALDQPEEAASRWEEVQQQAGGDYLPALWNGLRLAARQGDLDRLAQLYGELAGLSEDEAIKATLALRAAVLAEAAGDGQGDADMLRAALERNPEDAEPLLGLLARDDLSATERADLMLKLAGALQGSQREQLRLPMALALEADGRLAAARDELAPLLEQTPDNLAALMLLERMAGAAGEQLQQARLLVKLSDLQAEETARLAALRGAARLMQELERPEDAVALWTRILAQAPDDEDAVEALTSLHREADDLEALDRLMGHRIGRASAADRITLLLERAELRRAEGEDGVAAARDLLRVLDLDGDHPEALQSLATLYATDGNLDQALTLFRRLSTGLQDDAQRRELMERVVGILKDAGGRDEDVLRTYQDYLVESPDDEEVLHKVSELQLAMGNHEQAVQALERLAKLQPDAEGRGKNLRRIADIAWRQLEQPTRALEALTRALAGDPLDLDLVRDIMQLHREVNDEASVEQLLERVQADIREAMANNPMSVDLVKKLAAVSEWREDQYTLMATLGVLATLRAASDEEDILFLRALKKVAFKPKPDALEAGGGALIHPGARLEHGRIWQLAGVAVPAFLPPGKVPANVSAFGLKKGDRVDRRSASQVTGRIDRIAAALGVSDSFDIYLSSKDPDLVAGIAGPVPTLIVGHSVVSELTAARRFRLGRALYLMRYGAFGLDQLSADQLQLIYCAAIFSQNSKATLPMAAGTLKPEAKKVNKALPRKLRKLLSKAVSQGIPDPAQIEQWREGVLTTANRAGLLVSGHVVASVEALVEGLRRDGDGANLTTDQAMARLRDNEQASRLLVFSVSEEYLALRRELSR